MLAAALNSPVTSPRTGPMSSAIEEQTIRWMAELVGFPTNCGGLFLSGGSAANQVALYAALYSRAIWDVRELGMSHPRAAAIRVYATRETHSSITKALVLLGLGTRALVEVAVDAEGRMDANDLARRVAFDREDGLQPLVVVGSAGTTSTGAMDPLPEIAAFCRQERLWLHVAGAYGAPAERHRLYLDDLNQKILAQLQDSGAAYPSHTTFRGAYVLRVCIVNFNTTRADIELLPTLVADLGARLHAERRALGTAPLNVAPTPRL